MNDEDYWILQNRWDFNEGTGDTCADSVALYGANTGTLQGAIKPQWIAGRNGGYALRFNGAENQYVSTSRIWDQSWLAGNIPAECMYYGAWKIWFRTTVACGRVMLHLPTTMTSTVPEWHDNDVCMYITTGGQVGVYADDISENWDYNANYLVAGPRVDDGEWHEAIFEMCARTLRLSVDGVEVASETHDVGWGNTSRYFRIGGSPTMVGYTPPNGIDHYLPGLLYDTRYNNAVNSFIGDIDSVSVYHWVDADIPCIEYSLVHILSDYAPPTTPACRTDCAIVAPRVSASNIIIPSSSVCPAFSQTKTVVRPR